MIRKTVSTVSSLLLLLVFSSGVVLAASTETREVVAAWFREQWENTILYHFLSDGDAAGFPTYRVGWVPVGMALADEIIEENVYIGTYEGSDEHAAFVFYYSTFDAARGFAVFDDDASKAKQVVIHGMTGEYVPTEDGMGGNLIWMNEEQQIAFAISSALSKSETMKIAQSVAMIKEASK